MAVNASRVVASSYPNQSDFPIVTSRYHIEVVMNECAHTGSEQERVAALAAEFQRALNNKFFVDLRYNHLEFEVTGREVVDVSPVQREERVDFYATQYFTNSGEHIIIHRNRKESRDEFNRFTGFLWNGIKAYRIGKVYALDESEALDLIKENNWDYTKHNGPALNKANRPDG